MIDSDMLAIIEDLRLKVADLERHNRQLRETVDALLQPAPSELLSKNLTHPSRMRTSDR
jgi:hypothetical protein